MHCTLIAMLYCNFVFLLSISLSQCSLTKFSTLVSPWCRRLLPAQSGAKSLAKPTLTHSLYQRRNSAYHHTSHFYLIWTQQNNPVCAFWDHSRYNSSHYAITEKTSYNAKFRSHFICLGFSISPKLRDISSALLPNNIKAVDSLAGNGATLRIVDI